MTLSVTITFLARLSLVLLFLPFSALDKIINFDLAREQAGGVVNSKVASTALVMVGLFVEIVMSLGILTGVADRLAALVLAAYCVLTAVLWKPFWRQPDFTLRGPSEGRDMFWDFLKNFALAGGFLMITVGPSATSVQQFITAPLSSTHPYKQAVGNLPP
jgi:putative oxidoreductase